MTTRIWIGLALVYVVWGSTYLAIRYSVESLPPFIPTGARFALSAVLLAGWLAARGRSLRIGWPALGSCLLVGTLLLAGGIGLVVLAETARFGLGSGVAALLVAAVPLMVVLLRLAFREPTPGWTILGTVVGLVGLGILVWPGDSGGIALAGALLVVGAAAGWSIGSFLSGRLPLPADPMVASVYQMALGGGVLMLMGWADDERVDFGAVTGRSWLAWAFLLIFASLIAYTAYVWLLAHAPISLVATYAYVNPAIAVLLGVVAFNEPLGWRTLLGGAVILTGVVAVITTERPTPIDPASANRRATRRTTQGQKQRSQGQLEADDTPLGRSSGIYRIY